MPDSSRARVPVPDFSIQVGADGKIRQLRLNQLQENTTTATARRLGVSLDELVELVERRHQ